jgi:hypothetical protein
VGWTSRLPARLSRSSPAWRCYCRRPPANAPRHRGTRARRPSGSWWPPTRSS